MLLLFKFIFSFQFVFANPQFFNGETLEEVELSDVAKRVRPGTVLVFGEIHDSEVHHQNQRDLLVKLTQRKDVQALSVGMEFIDYTQQPILNSFLEGALSEEQFLEQINWGGTPFEHYRFQVKLPPYRQGWTYGINLPRNITSKVSQGGLDSLSDEERALLPPNFQMGSQEYFERFEAVMKGHVPEEAILKYFTAQSLWDDTMAWQSLGRMSENPKQSLVILVGDFHAAWGHGLANRLRARGARDVLVISQVESIEEVGHHPKYGARGDFVFVSNEPKKRHGLMYEFLTRLTHRH